MPARSRQEQIAYALQLVDDCIGLARNCRKGKPCGRTCISQSKKCRIGGIASHANDQQLVQAFSGAGQVTRSGVAVSPQLFGHQATDADLSGLAGSPTHGHITARGTSPPPRLSLTVSSPQVRRQERTVYRDRTDGKLVMHNDYFRVEDQAPDGYGTHSFANQVKTAQRFGVDRIETTAAGNFRDMQSGSWNGYYTWPRLGYDAPLYSGEIASLPSNLRNARSVQDLMGNQEGRDWWKLNGSTRDMKFDLSPNSKSIKVLNNYLEEKGFSTRV